MASALNLLQQLMKAARPLLPSPGTAVPKLSMPPAGTAPGIEAEELKHCPRSEEPVHITCIDYSPEQSEVQEVTDVADFLSRHRPSWSCVRWINVDGLKRMDLIHALAEKYQLHPLAVEDILQTTQRPKAEDYPASAELPGRLFVVARSIESSEGQLYTEQISFVLGPATLLTFQEVTGDAFDPIRQRIQVQGSRLRENDASFLLYSLLDAIVDSYFPILERCSERLEELEEELLSRATRETLHKVHAMKRELLLIRRAAWPMRELIMQLQRDAHEGISSTTRTYFRDVYDHGVQIIDLTETTPFNMVLGGDAQYRKLLAFKEVGQFSNGRHGCLCRNRFSRLWKVLPARSSADLLWSIWWMTRHWECCSRITRRLSTNEKSR